MLRLSRGSGAVMNSDRNCGVKTMPELLHKETTGKIVGAAFEVYNTLGYGFLASVYRQSMQVELLGANALCETERRIDVLYKGTNVGVYRADLFVDERVIVEVKVAKEYNRADEAQLLNELKATGIKVGMLLNFGRERVEFKRMVF